MNEDMLNFENEKFAEDLKFSEMMAKESLNDLTISPEDKETVHERVANRFGFNKMSDLKEMMKMPEIPEGPPMLDPSTFQNFNMFDIKPSDEKGVISEVKEDKILPDGHHIRKDIKERENGIMTMDLTTDDITGGGPDDMMMQVMNELPELGEGAHQIKVKGTIEPDWEHGGELVAREKVTINTKADAILNKSLPDLTPKARKI